MTSTSDNVYSDANNTPPLATAVPLGLQHVLAMFASNVTPSIIVAGAAGLAFGFCGDLDTATLTQAPRHPVDQGR